MKVIGKPYAGEPQVLDQGEQDFVLWKILNGHEVEAAATAKVNLKNNEPVLYSYHSTFLRLVPFSSAYTRIISAETRAPFAASIAAAYIPTCRR